MDFSCWNPKIINGQIKLFFFIDQECYMYIKDAFPTFSTLGLPHLRSSCSSDSFISLHFPGDCWPIWGAVVQVTASSYLFKLMVDPTEEEQQSRWLYHLYQLIIYPSEEQMFRWQLHLTFSSWWLTHLRSSC